MRESHEQTGSGLRNPAWTLLAGAILAGAAGAQTPEWIWHGNARSTEAGEDVCFFRKTFRTPPYLWNSRLTVAAADAAEIFLNGISIATCEGWDRPLRTEVTVRLNQGDNAIAVRARNRSGVAGVLVQLTLGGEKTVVSDASWLVTTHEEPGWTGLAFNAAHWALAKSRGPHGVKPWGEVLFRAAATPAEAITVPAGFQVELLRSAGPGEGSWVCLTFDDRGRLILSPEGREHPLLRLTLRDGRVERVEPVGAPIRFAMGLLWANGSLYANCLGPQGAGLHRLVDADGDDQFSAEEVQLLKKFEGGGEHGYHALALGPDGKIYVLNGNGTKLPAGLSAASPHRHYGEDVLSLNPDETTRPGGLKAPAGHVLRTDAAGRAWELWLGGLRNAYDFAFSPDGELFLFDSDMEWDWGTPWYRPTRILQGVSGGEYGWRDGTRLWPADSPDSLPAVVDVGLGSPTGVKFGTQSRFPEPLRRALFVLDWSYGRILAVHLRPEGAGYRGTVETFLEGRPLNVTALAFGPDGALYFITGGRGTQSGLYRVRWTGPPNAATTGPAVVDEAAARARALRRQLEQFHGRPDPAAVDFVWPHLGSPDRFLRHAARIALEHQPVAEWRGRVLAETNRTVALTALLALARIGPREVQRDLLEGLERFPADRLDEEHRLLFYRILQLAFLRQGRPAPDRGAALRAQLDRQYPAPTWPQNRELVRLLVYLETPGVVGRTLDLLEAARTQEEQIHYIAQLRHLSTGWTLADRRRYFGWWPRSRETLTRPAELQQWFAEVDRPLVDGASLDRYLRDFRREAIARLSEDERQALAELLEAPFQKALQVPVSHRAFVREWRLADLLPDLDRVGAGRNFERGRQVFVEAQCLVCHRLGNDGGSIGPELDSAGRKYDRRSLLESILEPSAVINEAYQNTLVVLQNGDSLTGRIVFENDREVLLEIDPLAGLRQEIPRHQIQSLQPAPLSAMPEGLVNILTRDEILDLLAYLEAGGRR